MTDRLGDLHPSDVYSESADIPDDIEDGRGPDADAALSKFNREADAIDKVYVWANKSIQTVSSSLNDPDALPSAGAQLDTIDTKLDAVRKRLKRIAAENKELVSTQHTSPATMRIRVSRYTKLGNDFMAVVSKMQKVRETHKSLAENNIKQDILRANPYASEAQVQRALDDPDPTQLDSVMQTGNPQRVHQLEDLRSRNRDIQNLSKNIVELHQMFTDMSILVEGQQELINNIEYNVKEVKADTRKAAEELEVALQHQRSARKKKICICMIVVIGIIIIAAIIIIPMGISRGWFSSSRSIGNQPSSAAISTPSSSPITRQVLFHPVKAEELIIEKKLASID